MQQYYGGWAPKTYMQHLWVRYGITKEEYERCWTAQRGECAGCQGKLAHPFNKGMEAALRPEVDHNHSKPKGEIRGLLCRKCNDFLGKVQDNQETLGRLLAYLRNGGSL